ncbi:MAG TPA: S41 family peptidase [Solirubrobacterales bacterium]|jgi:carboxyl-terminal processing protease
MSTERRRGLIIGFLAGAAVALAAGAIVVAIGGGIGGSERTTQASDVIQNDYFRPVGGQLLENASVDGMVRTLRKRYDDHFSHYFNPHELRQFEQASSGHFSGVGLTVTEVERGLRVASVIPRTPAQRAGIDPGDLIVAVDGKSIAGESAQVSTARIKGRPGTSVELRVVSGANGGVRDVQLERATVQVPAVRGQMKQAGGTKVAYVRFATFSQGAHAELAAVLKRLDRKGAKGLVLDLRGNGGGLLDEAVLCASLFLKKGQLVVSTNSRTMGHHDYTALGDPLPTHPTVVLINHDTASAAEILTSALADHHLATVVGTRSFGKGTFQEVIHLAAGGALDLTVGEYLTADGTSLADKGIAPDVRAVDDPRTAPDEGLEKALAVLAEKAAVENR